MSGFQVGNYVLLSPGETEFRNHHLCEMPDVIVVDETTEAIDQFGSSVELVLPDTLHKVKDDLLELCRSQGIFAIPISSLEIGRGHAIEGHRAGRWF